MKGLETPESSTVWVGFLRGGVRVCMRRADGRSSHCHLDTQVWRSAWLGQDHDLIDLMYQCVEKAAAMLETQRIAESRGNAARALAKEQRWLKAVRRKKQ